MNVGNTDDRWKERFCLPRVAWSTFARNKKERGIVGRTSHDGVRQIYNWNPESGISEQITFTRSGASQAVISPDGRFVYFLSDDQGNEVGEIVRVPYTGGEEETVTPGLSEYSLVGHPSFSGDGRFLGFTYGADDEFNTCLVDLRSPDFSRRVIRTSTHLITMPILSEDGKVTVFGMGNVLGFLQKKRRELSS